MKAGVGEIDITPPVGGWLLGPLGPSTGVRERLFARALAVKDGDLTWIIICLDLGGFSIEFNNELRTVIRQCTGVGTVLLNCSHNHSAPFTIPWSYGGWHEHCREEAGWLDQLRRAIPDLALHATNSMAPATLCAGRSPVDVGINRRLDTDEGIIMAPNPGGPCMPWVDVLGVFRDDRLLAVLFSHAAHPVIVHNSPLICADYPGSAAAHIREELGEDVLPLFAQGFGGDINGHPLRGGHEVAEMVGRRLGPAAVVALEHSVSLQCSRFRTASTTLTLQCEQMPSAVECDREIQETENRLTELEPERRWIIEDRICCLRELKGMIVSNNLPSIPLEISLLACGNEWALLTMQHELFSEYGLWFNSKFGFRHAMTCAYTNGCEAYIPTDKDLKMGPLGGYEASNFPSAKSAGLGYRNRLAPRPGIEGLIKKAVEELVEQ